MTSLNPIRPWGERIFELCKNQLNTPQVQALLPPQPPGAEALARIGARAQRFADSSASNVHAEQILKVVVNKVAEFLEGAQLPGGIKHPTAKGPDFNSTSAASAFEKYFPAGIEDHMRTHESISLLLSKQPSFVQRLARTYSAHYALEIIKQNERKKPLRATGSDQLLPNPARSLALNWLLGLRTPVLDRAVSGPFEHLLPEEHWECRQENPELGARAINPQDESLETYASIHRVMRDLYKEQIALNTK